MMYLARSFFIVSMLIASHVISGFGQTPVSLGLRAGLNFANASTEGVSLSTSTRTGLVLGGLLEIGLSDAIFIQPEIFYIQKGAEFTISGGGQSATVTWKFDYIEMSALLKAKFGSTEFKPYIFGGPNIGINVVAEAEGKSGTQSQTVDLKNLIESTDFAFDIGVGGEYSMNEETSLVGDIRYSLGLSDIDKSESSWKSTGVQIILGVKFSL